MNKLYIDTDDAIDTNMSNTEYERLNYIKINQMISTTDAKWICFSKMFNLIESGINDKMITNDIGGDILFVDNGATNKYMQSDVSFCDVVCITNTFDVSGKCDIQYIDVKCIHSDSIYVISVKQTYSKYITPKYVYYYLLSIKSNIEKYFNTNFKLDIYKLCNMKFPIISLYKQNELVNYCEMNNNFAKI